MAEKKINKVEKKVKPKKKKSTQPKKSDVKKLNLETNIGKVTIELFDKLAPKHVERILLLANKGLYDNVVFHRVIDGFMAQTGDIQFGCLKKDYIENRIGTGGSNEPDLESEFSSEPFKRGVLGMAICNDRRWSETYRVLGLKGCELALIGYNTPIHYPPDPSQDVLAGFHNQLVMQSGAYQNGMWVVGVAKAGNEEGCDLLGESSIIAPSGEVVAQCSTVGDELIYATVDLDMCANYKETLFDFARYRRPEVYKTITSQVGVEIPDGVETDTEDSKDKEQLT